ncbi:MAG: hypothetical protein GY816_11315 [Cytophagales bacterium]|nr:hypothetical protein [Cytophagales bacterium]
MKKLMYTIGLVILSSVLFSCKEELVNPIDEVETEVSTEESTEGVDPDEDGGSKKME